MRPGPASRSVAAGGCGRGQLAKRARDLSREALYRAAQGRDRRVGGLIGCLFPIRRLAAHDRGEVRTDDHPAALEQGRPGGVLESFPTSSLQVGSSSQCHVVDLDGDGLLDVVVGAAETAEGVRIYYNGGDPPGSLVAGKVPVTADMFNENAPASPQM